MRSENLLLADVKTFSKLSCRMKSVIEHCRYFCFGTVGNSDVKPEIDICDHYRTSSCHIVSLYNFVLKFSAV